jgi:hypothetical protein
MQYSVIRNGELQHVNGGDVTVPDSARQAYALHLVCEALGWHIIGDDFADAANGECDHNEATIAAMQSEFATADDAAAWLAKEVAA